MQPPQPGTQIFPSDDVKMPPGPHIQARRLPGRQGLALGLVGNIKLRLTTARVTALDMAFQTLHRPDLTHLVLADLVGGPGMDSLDHGGAAARVEVEDFHCPAPAGGQHQVWALLGNASLRSTEAGSQPAPHAGPASLSRGAGGGGG